MNFFFLSLFIIIIIIVIIPDNLIQRKLFVWNYLYVCDILREKLESWFWNNLINLWIDYQ